jgi:hypothetical protein
MNGKRTLALLVTMGILLLGTSQVTGQQDEPQSPQAPYSYAFTYQGQLKSGGTPYNGACDLRFGLWDALSGGLQIGTTYTRGNVNMTDGYFTVFLSFGESAFRGDERWLQIEVRCPAGAGSYTALDPRQELTAAPYALALPGLWTQPNAESPNLIGGYSGNWVTAGVVGATIGGGGTASYYSNRVTDHYGTVGGGQRNQAGNYSGTLDDARFSTVSGGVGHVASNDSATVGGGWYNTASGGFSIVGGGRDNVASGTSATVGGGDTNTASGDRSTVSGGWHNMALDEYVAVGGGYAIVAVGSASTVSGGWGNTTNDDYGTVAGGYMNFAGDQSGSSEDRPYATVGGGRDNVASGTSSVVAGGDTNTASGWRSTVPGGVGNVAAGEHSFAAGRRAKALHDGAFVWADSHDADFSSDAANEFLVRAYNGVKIVRGASTFSASQSALQVDQAAAAEAGWFYVMNASNPYTVLKVAKDPTAPSTFIDGVDRTSGGAETRRFHIDSNGSYVAGSDFAESLPVVGDLAGYEPGDVLVISLNGPSGVEKCSQPYDGLVVGVYSTRPGFLGADKEGATEVAADEVPVAVLGIVPVKVTDENGPIQPGDLLTTSSTPGRAMRCAGLELCFGRTLGKALEGLPAGQHYGVIRVLVTLQ